MKTYSDLTGIHRRMVTDFMIKNRLWYFFFPLFKQSLNGHDTIIQVLHSPVTGASMSIMVFSDLRSDAPSLTMRNAAASSIRPSRMKCCFNMSGRGLFVLWSHTSAVVNFRPGGNGTPATEEINGLV